MILLSRFQCKRRQPAKRFWCQRPRITSNRWRSEVRFKAINHTQRPESDKKGRRAGPCAQGRFRAGHRALRIWQISLHPISNMRAGQHQRGDGRHFYVVHSPVSSMWSWLEHTDKGMAELDHFYRYDGGRLLLGQLGRFDGPQTCSDRDFHHERAVHRCVIFHSKLHAVYDLPVLKRCCVSLLYMFFKCCKNGFCNFFGYQ